MWLIIIRKHSLLCLAEWRSLNCPYLPRNIFLINQISWGFFVLFCFWSVINHLWFLWNSLFPGTSTASCFLLLNSENLFSIYFLFPSPLLQNHFNLGCYPRPCLLDTSPAGPPCLSHWPPLLNGSIFCHQAHPDRDSGPQQDLKSEQLMGKSELHRGIS